MSNFIALSEFLDIGPESRYFLQVLLSQKQDVLAVPYKIKPLAKRLCLTERLVREASLELVEARLLEGKKSADKVGRPGQSFEMPLDRQLDLLSKSGRGDCFHQGLVQRLFSEPDIYALGPLPEAEVRKEKAARLLVCKDGQPAAPGARGRLGPATRVLLAALLASADQCGFVSGLMSSKLRAMTGMTALALKHQMKRLISLGFIRSYVPGVSNAAFSKSKVSSLYYMNLDHPQLGAQQRSRALAVYMARGPGKLDTLALGLPPHAERALKALDPAALVMLYHKLANCTSHLLSLSLMDVDSASGAARAAVSEMISAELQLLKVGSSSEGGSIFWEGTRENFLAAACEWAETLRKRLFGKVWPGYVPELVRLIPAPKKIGDFRGTSVIVYPAPSMQKDCTVLWDEFKGRTDTYDSEAELVLALRYRLGLLTAPA